ncbi:hypothetical protein A3H65_03175 [Candidatus Giovannonibacteria bacterium RIFCSPLOWO2_02_FULL_45_14]|uniref:Uncharacterized protein n=1 Tax=Candidatus Giovannonibacteria bacterium RIFCSPLOWO2_12_FULL_44_15 TaxID=1798364 RepID=A0A1F5Y129_9BACT|nr:MAG: hypothetical protein A3C75_00355 [Candidatus Giovannonibacteria bacterium RIFCSPHIGHO2_02_FULL_44_31]OGF77021.1 MAG: hypothetical protein A3E62_04125 [Candidatus Giovannonibacteria bacterium RIFCSPHIGHO2_12_FULL_44_29]OGF90799.1 MAG: hypothetical protein A3H65_03175 [Candidatus Giovannonibacteria bacterium RIFCSPLOWO2_02_FULL_45_14]OGF93854.1 MAG: hypothetical protein A3G54_03790 [Candidatus Giovannonibacteria bacterium RIFCSPLOWO2_12_FULL_44_15]
MRSQYSGTLDPAIKELFQPDTLAHEEYLKTFKPREMEPEKRVMLAVLEEAVHCFQKYICAKYPKEISLFDDAEAWFMDESDGGLFSFVSVCEILGLDPAYVRKGLFAWRDAKIAAVAKEPEDKRRRRRLRF